MRRQVVQGDLGQILVQLCRHMGLQSFGQMRTHIAQQFGASGDHDAVNRKQAALNDLTKDHP